MQNWLISANGEKYDFTYYLDKYGCVNWQQHKFHYEVEDIVYIYSTIPQKLMYKTVVEETNISFPESAGNFVRLRLLQEVDKEELSRENLKRIGIQPVTGAKKLDENLVNYIEKYFEGDNMKNMWMVRAGEKGFLYDEIKKRNIVVIGWGIGDVKNLSKDEIIKLLKEKQKNLPEKEKKTKKGIEQNASTIVRFRDELKKGDYVVSASPLSERYLLGEITSDYYFSDELIEDKVDDKLKYNNLRKVKWLCEISSDELSESTTHSLEHSKQTLFNINDEIRDEILSFYVGDNDWKNKPRNVIYFGAPGTGKSFKLNSDKEKLLCCKNDYERVTFHPDYSYANFVGTYKPRIERDENGKKTGITYEYVPGPFMRSLVKALKNPNKPFLLIIEEINRSNVAAVFGDVFQLLDRDKDKNYESEYDIDISEDIIDYLEKELDKVYRKIKIPSNMFIWATMNSADQGVFPMDTAFKRRWDFKYLGINCNEDKIEHIKFNFNGQEISWNDLRKEINKKLLSFKINEDKLIGPFYAFNEYFDEEEYIERTNTEEAYKDLQKELKKIFKNKIIMYLFEDAAKSRRIDLFAGAKENEEDTNITYSRVCKIFDNNGIAIFPKDMQNNLQSKMKNMNPQNLM